MIWQVLLTPSLPSLAGGGTLKLYSNDTQIAIAASSSKIWNYGEPFILSFGIVGLSTAIKASIILDGITIYQDSSFYSGESNIVYKLYDFVDTWSSTGAYGLSFPVYNSIKITNGTTNYTMGLNDVRVYKYITN